VERNELRRLATRPLPLQPTPVRYLIPGGSLLREYLGGLAVEEDRDRRISQRWIASTIGSSLGDGEEGMSRLSAELGGMLLRELLAAAPEEFMGAAHAAEHGAEPGFLFKLLNSRDRLLVQVHPDREKAQKHFGSHYGKTEAWHVLAVEPGAVAWAGFTPGVTREGFMQSILEEDAEKILGCLHEFSLKPGDTLFIPAGLPHAIGGGSLVMEIQEPTDITLRAERRRPGGERLPEGFLHAGRGMEVLLDCFTFETFEREEARKKIFLERHMLSGGPGWRESALLSHEVTPYFALHEIRIEAGARCVRHNDPFTVILVLSGEGVLEADGQQIACAKGTEIFMPHGVKDYSCAAVRDMRLVECLPPRVSQDLKENT
jgi:mannose-6-phosphate isomerase